jgi:hypothetical protein
MKKYSESVLTKDRKGNSEVRNLVSKGKFVVYDYRNPETFALVESKKLKLYLVDGKNKKSFYLIPLKGNRFLMIEAKEDKEERKVWNEKTKKEEYLWK